MEPLEKPATIDTLARRAGEQQISLGKTYLYNLMDSLDKIATSTGQLLWGAFVTLRLASARVLAIFIIFRLIKYIADILICCYALHGIYEWSLYLIGALWGSLAQFLLHLPKGSKYEEPLMTRSENPTTNKDKNESNECVQQCQNI